MSTGVSATPSPSDPTPTTPATESAKESKAKKRLWDVLLTATPVLLTILATILASKSASEMTQAQYHGTLASRDQSKAGNQWAYFQAKRIRGTVQSMKADLGAFDSTMALALSDRFPKALNQLKDDAKELSPELKGELTQLDPAVQGLQKALDDASKQAEAARATLHLFLVGEVVPGSKVSESLAPLTSAPDVAEEVKKAVQKLLDNKKLDAVDEEALKGLAKVEKAPDAGKKTVKTYLTGVDFRKSKVYLEKDSLPLPKDADPKDNPFVAVAKLVAKTDKTINEVATDIRERKPRDDYQAKLKKIKAVDIRHVLEEAENLADVYDKSCDKASDSFKMLDKLLVDQKDKLRKVEQAAVQLRAALDSLPRKVRRDTNATRDDARALADSAERLDPEARTQYERFTAALCDYQVRRYDREAKFNQAIAGLYEVPVHKNSYESDASMAKRDLYMYGMLAAQAGVAVATFALAVRFAGVLFAIAAVAGVLAILMMGMGMGLLAAVGLSAK